MSRNDLVVNMTNSLTFSPFSTSFSLNSSKTFATLRVMTLPFPRINSFITCKERILCNITPFGKIASYVHIRGSECVMKVCCMYVWGCLVSSLGITTFSHNDHGKHSKLNKIKNKTKNKKKPTIN